MTRDDHRRLFPWLLAVASALVVVLVAQALGLGGAVTWLPPMASDDVSSTPGQAPPPTVPLQAYANTWEHPLFAPGRQADVTAVDAGTPLSLDGLTLTGSVITDHLRIALLKDASGKAVALVQGATLPNGWTLERLDATEALFVSGAQQQRLRLRPARP